MVKNLLVTNALALLVWMSLWFLVGKRRRRLDTVDTAWGTGFILVAWISALHVHRSVSYIIAALITIWGLRLSLHLFTRNQRHKDDPRYLEIASKWQGNYWLRAYFSIFILQGFMIFIISLPVDFAAGPLLSNYHWVVAVGIIDWIFGFVYEAVADKQLRDFVGQPKNKGKLLNTGLWRYSRHPNYFGEITQWLGIAVLAMSAANGWVGLVGPIFLTFLIVFISGLPLIEKRKAKDKAYQAYIHTTSAIIPWPPKNLCTLH